MRFLSLRYSADFGHSRLVLLGTVRLFLEVFGLNQRAASSFFATELMFKKPERVPLLHFSALCYCSKFSFSFFFEKIFYVSRGSHFIFFKFCNNLLLQKPKESSPFTIVKTLRFLSLRYSAVFGLTQKKNFSDFHFSFFVKFQIDFKHFRVTHRASRYRKISTSSCFLKLVFTFRNFCSENTEHVRRRLNVLLVGFIEDKFVDFVGKCIKSNAKGQKYRIF